VARVTNSLLSVTSSPGFYFNLVRNLNKSLSSVGFTLVDGGFDSVGEGVTSVVSALSTLRRSMAIGFLDTCARLGDIVIDIELRGGDSRIDVDAIPESIVTLTKGVTQAPGVAVLKSKTTTGNLAWRNSSSPALLLLPTALVKANMGFGTNVNVLAGTIASQVDDKHIISDSVRLSFEDVANVERSLDAEYVPFYFHDLRTNEIVSFHAFLETLSDKYSAEYNKQEGFGRVDPIMTYKSTERTVDLSFFVVSTGEVDFDEMWVKINKLVTLVYPQWGRGRQVASNDGSLSFTQPFSQIQTASPMIRLRVGDVVKSNFSRFNLARIFGLGSQTAGDIATPELSDGQRSELDTIAARESCRHRHGNCLSSLTRH
jgi:hypothetical protein